MVEIIVDGEDCTFGIRCPICKDCLSAPFVNGMGKKADSYTLSNFQRHLREVHIPANSKRGTKRSSKQSTKPDVKRVVKKLKVGKLRPRKQQKQKETSSDSEEIEIENDRVAKDLAKNYLNEEDDLADDDLDEDLADDHKELGHVNLPGTSTKAIMPRPRRSRKKN